MKKLTKNPGRNSRGTVRRREIPIPDDREERILRAATIHLIHKHGMFLVATGAREFRLRGLPAWVITVTLRYTTGRGGYIGDLLYDGEEYTFLTEKALMDERAELIANDPEAQREWNEYRASTLQTNQEQHLCTRLPANGLFRRAYEGLGGSCVVCSKPGITESTQQ